MEDSLKEGKAEDSRQGPSVRGNGRKKVCKKKTKYSSTRKTQNSYTYKWMEQYISSRDIAGTVLPG